MISPDFSQLNLGAGEAATAVPIAAPAGRGQPVGWQTSIVRKALARSFAAPPAEAIWEWADRVVMLQNEDAAEPGPYRSAKTPWTRRLQELMREPVMWVWDFERAEWTRVRVTEVSVRKSSQSGFSEACLNGIRWRASYRPCNVIYAIDTADEAKKIARRLLRSFRFLDPSIFTGDPDDIKSLEFILRGMELLFIGSFSSGKYANKQASLLIVDELEEHGSSTGDTSTSRNIKSRKKTSSGGLQINLSKPKLAKGPIDELCKRGNEEQFHVPCPHCGHMQYLTPSATEVDSPYSEEVDEIRDEATGEVVARLPRPLPLGQTRKVRTGRLVFEHCKNLLGQWDKLRILRETYYECAECHGAIEESRKEWMRERGAWRPTALGTPGVVSQNMSDLLSSDEESAWGVIVLEWLDAKKEGRRELQGVFNHRFGLPWKEEANKTEASDIKANIAGRAYYFVDDQDERGHPRRTSHDTREAAERTQARMRERGVDTPIVASICPPYRRGTIPFIPQGVLMGADVGGHYARWAALGVAPNGTDVAVIDWGEELDPAALAEVMRRNAWPCAADGKRYKFSMGFVDGRYRGIDVVNACLSVPGGRMIPCFGQGGVTARGLRNWSYNVVPSYPKNMRVLNYNDRAAKDELYIERIHKRWRRVWFPIDVVEDEQFMEEMTAEELVPASSGVGYVWKPDTGANHYGDSVKNALTGLRFVTRKQTSVRGTEEVVGGEVEEGIEA